MLERLRKSQKQIVIGALILVAATYIPLFLSADILEFFVNEDHLFENLTPVYFLITSILLFVAFFKLRSEPGNKGFFLKKLGLLGMALLFFVAAGEEISWGQRIFNIQTPEELKEVNVQQEITFHNLAFFQGESQTLDFSQLEMLFSLTLAFGIPFLGVILKRINKNLDAIFPVFPIQIGFLVLVNYIIQKILRNVVDLVPQYYLHPSMPFTEGLYEIREHANALILMLSVFFYVLFLLSTSKSEETIGALEEA